MNKHYLLSANGPDHPGIVASVTEVLYKYKCNLEDSSMMRLGAEFGIFLIFSSNKKLDDRFYSDLEAIGNKINLQIACKPVSKKLANSSQLAKNAFRVTLHGADRPGLVFKLTQLLSRSKFNITDLQTHRIDKKQAGYVLFVEGNFPSSSEATQLQKHLDRLKQNLNVTIHIDPIDSFPL